MDRTAQHIRIRRLAWLLSEVRTYEPADLTMNPILMQEVRDALAVAPSEHALERELHDLLTRTVEAPDTVESYDADRAIAEAEGLVGPGGAIAYQYQWQNSSGEWSKWSTWRTRTTMQAPVPNPADARTIHFRIAPAQS